MFKNLIFAVTLLLVAQQSSAITYVWNGTNTDPGNSANYVANRGLSSTTCAFDYQTGGVSVASNFGAQSYSVGKKIVLGDKAIFKLSNTGTVFRFSDKAVTEGCTSTFKAPVANDLNNIGRPCNYYNNLDNTQVPLTICKGDELIFPKSVWVHLTGMPTQANFTVDIITYNGIEVSKTSDWSRLGVGFATINPNQVTLNPRDSDCYSLDSKGNCQCLVVPGCSEAADAEQARIIAGEEKKDAEEQLNEQNTIVSRTLGGDLNADALSLTQTQLDSITDVASIRTAVEHLLNNSLPGVVTVTNLQITGTPKVFSFTATISAPQYLFASYGSGTIDVSAATLNGPTDYFAIAVQRNLITAIGDVGEVDPGTPTFTIDENVMTTPWVEFAANIPAISKVRWLDTQNKENFDALLKDVAMPTGFTVNKVDTQLANADPNPKRRRRSTSNDYGTYAQVNYTVYCQTGSASCSLTAAQLTALSAALTTLANTFTATGTKYFNVNTLTYNWTLINQDASAQCQTTLDGGSTQAAAQEAARVFALGIVECGVFPRFNNGTCFSYDANADIVVTARLTNPSCSSSVGNPTVDKSSSGGSGSSLPIIAAAAGGGFLLVVILIVIIMRRRKSRSTGPSKAADDRTVVAFENPMYDDPGKEKQPMYESAGMGGGEGLYDEPAFQQNAKKENPLYQSAENLAVDNPLYDQNEQQGEGEYDDVNFSNEAGYLDTNQTMYDNAGDGYLDTAPNNPNNPGYLDTAPAKPQDAPGYLDTAPADIDANGGGYLDVGADEENE